MMWCGLAMELPPRARRIPLEDISKENIKGTTSACAENTYQQQHPHDQTRNYLRVRGEYRMRI